MLGFSAVAATAIAGLLTASTPPPPSGAVYVPDWSGGFESCGTLLADDFSGGMTG